MEIDNLDLIRVGKYYAAEIDARYISCTILPQSKVMFYFMCENEEIQLTKNISEVIYVLVNKVLSMREIQKIGLIIAKELNGIFLIYDLGRFRIIVNNKSIVITKTDREMLDLLKKYKNVDISPNIIIKRSYKFKDSHVVIGGTLNDRRKRHYFFLKGVELNNKQVEVPNMYYDTSYKKWYEGISYFEKEEFDIIIKSIKQRN